jgi:hypothetical protein
VVGTRVNDSRSTHTSAVVIRGQRSAPRHGCACSFALPRPWPSLLPSDRK